MNQQDAINAVCEELKRAQAKFPLWPDDPVHAAAVVNEESGELIRAALQFNWEGGESASMLEEAVQVGAMAIRFLMSIKDYEVFEVPQHSQEPL